MAGTKTNTPKTEQPANKPCVLKAKQVEDQSRPVKIVESAAEKPRTIRSICEEGLLAGLPYDQVIANVKVIHPDAGTTPGCISWYRTKMVKRGLLPSGKEMAAARKRADAEGAPAGEK
jgi:hypothetical protein